MKKAILLAVFILLTGCSNHSPINNSSTKSVIENKEPIFISRGTTIAYALMKNGTHLVNITKVFDKKNKPHDIEVIAITSNGFYPAEYSIPNGTLNCGANYSTRNKSFCESHYNSSELSKSPLKGALVAVLSGGLAFAPGSKTPTLFDEEKFRNVIIKNNLQDTRIKLVSKTNELNSLVKSIQSDLNSIYLNEYRKYESNLSNIQLVEKTHDKSGFAKNIKISSKFKIKLAAPKQKEYLYDKYLSIEDILHNFNSLKSQLIEQGKKDKLEYTKYIQDSFKNATYLVSGKSENIYKHNLYVEFNYTVQSPSKIPYKLNQKVFVPIDITINSANLYNMVPKKFYLKNNDILVQMDKVIEKDLSMKVSLYNYKKEYLSALSLSSYYKKDVFSKKNFNIEIAPAANTVPLEIDNILSSNILKTANYKYISKKDADKTYISYGYAVKYKSIDADKEKTLFDQKRYTLSQIAKEYL